MFLLKVPIKFVNIIDSSTGRPKTVEIVDGQGNLKYHFLIHLFEAGVLIPDEYSATAFRYILKRMHALKAENNALRFEFKTIMPENVVAKQEFAGTSGSDNTRSDDEALVWLDELIEWFERH